LLQFFANLLLPLALSKTPCPKVILAGTPCARISCIATNLKESIYCLVLINCPFNGSKLPNNTTAKTALQRKNRLKMNFIDANLTPTATNSHSIYPMNVY
jgi:hypothetical protein